MLEFFVSKENRIQGKAWICNLIDKIESGVYVISLSKKKKLRSLDANAYCWSLIDRIAAKTHLKKTDVYRQMIVEIGDNSVMGMYKDEEAKDVCLAWQRQGVGWVTEVSDSKYDGYKLVRLYYGSSVYDGEQMSRLIDLLIQECEQLGIPTIAKTEVDEMKQKWDS